MANFYKRRELRLLAGGTASAALLFLAAAGAHAAPVVVNGSFEDSAAPAYPGYGAIAGWTGSDLARTGVNTSVGPFWDNGMNLHGSQVALIQSALNDSNEIHQNVAGFEAGKSYEIRMRVNARNYLTLRPRARVLIDGRVTTSSAVVNAVSNVVNAGNTGNPFILLTSQFASPGTGTFQVMIENAETRGDCSLLVDGVEIVEIADIAPVASLSGSALRYNGTTSTVEIARPVQGDFTIEFWLHSHQLSGGEGQWYQGHGLVDGEVGGQVPDFGVTLGAGKVLFGVGDPDTTIKSGVVADGSWHHVAATREAASGSTRLYIDSAQVASGVGTNQQLTSPTVLRVGSTNFDGALDEIRIWSRARTASEIARDYRRQLTGSEFGLVRYYRLDETTGTVAADSSAVGADATVVGGAAWTAGSPSVDRVVTGRNQDAVATLTGFDASASPLTATVTALPAAGDLYQYNAGVRGAVIAAVPTAVSDSQGRVIFAPDADATGSPYTTFGYRVNDGLAASTPATVTVVVLGSLTAAADWQLFQ